MHIFEKHDLSFRPMDQANARAIIHWRYEPPYDTYNLNPADIGDAVHDYVLPENAYYSIHDRSEELNGYCCFGRDAQVPGGDYQDDALDVGLGSNSHFDSNTSLQRYIVRSFFADIF